MLRAHPNVIGAFLRSWEGPNGLTRWYYNKWERFISPSQITDYRARYGVDPADEDAGIRVFFDDSGYLHIDNCRCSDLKLFLEDRMAGWYRWAREEYRRKQGSPPMNVLEMIEPHTKALKDGFYQTRYKDAVFNFDEEIRFMLSETYLPFDHSVPGYHVCTGFPRLDGIVRSLLNDQDSAFPAVDILSGLFERGIWG